MFSDSVFDLKVVLAMVFLALIVAGVTFALSKRIYLAALVFSVLANMAVFSAALVGSRLFEFYNIVWLKYFSVLAWPIANVILVVRYKRQKIIL